MNTFDTTISRKNTNSVKWDIPEKKYHQNDLLPFWIADMDFHVLPAVQNAFQEYIKQGVFGYTYFPQELFEAVIQWQATQHHYHLQKEEILFHSGVVPSIALAIQAFTQPNDAILIHDPVYPPFASVVKANHRKLVRNQLIEKEQFQIDFDRFEELIIEEKVKLFILCNPHNPGGRVWQPDELYHMGRICQKHQVLVVSDEIHQDLVFAPNLFTTYHNVDASFSDHSLVLTSATKTFNLAGIKHSMVFIKNPDLRQKFSMLQKQLYQNEINTFGMIGTQAAYQHGTRWLTDLLVYIEENIQFTLTFLKQHLPQVTCMQPQATYLLWLDFSSYGLTNSQLNKKMIEEAGVVLNAGITFGSMGDQHMRLNVACPRKNLEEGLKRIAKVF